MRELLRRFYGWVISFFKRRGEEFQGESRDSHQVRKYNAILKCTCYPNQIQRILVHAHLPRQTTGIVAAQKRSAIWIDAYAEITYPDFKYGLTNYVCYCLGNTRIDLRWIVDWWVRAII